MTAAKPVKEIHFTVHSIGSRPGVLIIHNLGDGRFKFGVSEDTTNGEVADALDALDGLVRHLRALA